LWIGDHWEHLKNKFVALYHDTFHSEDVLSEVIAPEVITHLLWNTARRGLGHRERQDSLGVWRDAK
jgi:hypothetical protein